MVTYRADPATHPAHHTPDDWWACEHPERPPDWFVGWGESCRPCRVHLAATLRNHPEQATAVVEDADGSERCVPFARAALGIAEKYDDPVLAAAATAALHG